MRQEKEIIILSVTRTKNGKSILEYIEETIGESEYRVGYLIRQDWRDNETWYGLKDKIGFKAKVKVGYRSTSNGRIYEYIEDVLDVSKKAL